jgi:hypothetical protein
MASKQIRPIRVEGNVAYVPLTQGYEAIIDAADVPLVEGLNWFAQTDKRRDGSVRNVYAARTDKVNGRNIASFLHRVVISAQIGVEVDHRDNNGLNNQRANLRIATREQNARNQRRQESDTARGTTYVKRRRKWQAQIKVGGRSIYLGMFGSEAAAHAAYIKASAELHGEFGRTA